MSTREARPCQLTCTPAMEGQPGEEQSRWGAHWSCKVNTVPITRLHKAAWPAACRFEGVREALRRDAAAWFVSHIDITCDGCEVEPITGHRQARVCREIAPANGRLRAARPGNNSRQPASAGAGAASTASCRHCSDPCLARCSPTGSSAPYARTLTCASGACGHWWRRA